MSLVVPEAMAAAMPVVTTKTCGMKDVIEDGKTGFLVKPRDARELTSRIEQLIKDEELRRRFGLAAQEKVKELRWEVLAKS